MLCKIRLAVALLVVSVAAYAQSTYGTIYGSVTDPSSAVIKEAVIEAKNPNTGAVRSVKTGADGTFRFVNLDPGSYSVSAAASGFSSQEKRITLPAREEVAADFQLALAGAAATSVEVDAEGQEVSTHS